MSMLFSLFRTRHYLTKNEKSKYLYFLLFQIILGILDLIAVALIGAVTLLALNGAINFPKMIASIENIVNLKNLKFLAIASLTIFLIKTILSFILSRLTLNFAKKIQMRIFTFQIKEVGKINFQSSYRLISNYLGQNLTEGINAFSLGIIGYSLLAASEIFLISIIFAPLFVFAPTLTLFTLLVFTLSFYVIHHITSIWSVKSGSQRIKSFEDIRNFVADTLRIAKILRVTDSYTNFTKKIVQSGRKSAEANADVYLIQLIPKYVLEGTIIVGATLLGIYFSFQNDFGKSIGIISIFLAASMRLLPSLLRLQGAILIIRKSFGESEMFLKTMELLNLEFKVPQSNIPTLDDDNLIEYQNISFSYSKSGNLVFSEFSNFIPRNKITVIEGPSGSGKTTLLDLTLGLLEVNTGQIRSRLNSFQIGYMTQDSLIVSGSVAENITLGKDFKSVGGLSPARCLDLVGLQSWVESLPNGLETQISSNSNFMSGGQRQRLGLARALFSSDELLIIDEPTSSLDYDSEDLIFDSLQQLKGTKTVIIVAHSHKPSLFADHKITLT